MSMLAILVVIAAQPRFASEEETHDPLRGFVGLSVPLPKLDSSGHPLDRQRYTLLVVPDCESCSLRRTDIKGFVSRYGDRGILLFTSDRAAVEKSLNGQYPPSQPVIFSPWPSGLPLELGAYAPVQVIVDDNQIEDVHA